MDYPAPQPRNITLIDALTNCGNELELLSSMDRGRVLRALVELYRKDFEQRSPAKCLQPGQFATGAAFDPMSPLGPKYGNG